MDNLGSEADIIRRTIRNMLIDREQLSDPTARKVSYSVGGLSIDWVTYKNYLTEEIARLRQELQSIDGPYDIITAVQ